MAEARRATNSARADEREGVPATGVPEVGKARLPFAAWFRILRIGQERGGGPSPIRVQAPRPPTQTYLVFR